MSSIVRDEKGAYRWVYEFNLFTNPTILFTILKIFLGIVVALVVFLLVLLVPDLARGYADSSDVLGTLQLGGGLALLFAALTLVGYVVYALMQGGKYCVVFTMDDAGITHQQLPRQYKKAEVISALNVLAGLATGSPTLAGVGLTSARDSITSDFSAVRSIKGSRALRVIKVNEPLTKNQVYVEPDDYDFVLGFIRDRCPNASDA